MDNPILLNMQANTGCILGTIDGSDRKPFYSLSSGCLKSEWTSATELCVKFILLPISISLSFQGFSSYLSLVSLDIFYNFSTPFSYSKALLVPKKQFSLVFEHTYDDRAANNFLFCLIESATSGFGHSFLMFELVSMFQCFRERQLVPSFLKLFSSFYPS